MPAIVSIISDAGDTDIPYRAKYTGEAFTLTMRALTRDGDALDMSGATLSMTLSGRDAGGDIEKTDADFTCPVDGVGSKCSVDFSAIDTETADEYVGQLTIQNSATDIVKSDPITMILMSGEASLTLGELRYALQDEPELNEFLEARELSDELLAMARRRAISMWNSRPGSHTTYTVENFPADTRRREAWLLGSMAKALEMTATGLLRNRVQMEGPGIGADDRGPRAEAALQLAQKWENEWKSFIVQQQWSNAMAASWYTI